MGVSTDALLFYGIAFDEDIPGEDNDAVYYTFQKAQGKDAGFGYGYHCSDELPLLYICIENTHRCANRGYPIKILPKDLIVDPSWDSKLESWCSTLSLPYTKPGWTMASYWG